MIKSASTSASPISPEKNRSPQYPTPAPIRLGQWFKLSVLGYIRGIEMANTERESINFKLPKTLTNALRTAARERKTTATDLVIQGLHHILGQVPGTEASVEIRLHQIEAFLTQMANGQDAGVEDSSKQRLSLLEQRLCGCAERLVDSCCGGGVA